MAGDAAPAWYFPVREATYQMEAGLQRFGIDFGNGEVDQQFFQIDREAARYEAAKAAVPKARAGVLDRGDDEQSAHRTVLHWMRERLAAEHPGRVVASLPANDFARDYADIAASIQEDFTVLYRNPSTGTESAIAVFVALPTGWRPERILGASFAQIHAPVPEFADDDLQSRSLVSSMIDRGPYVRFVWSVTADDGLDHHPEEGRRGDWRADGRGWLRVERQVTVPFRAEHASLFLIRVYLYPFEELPRAQRRTLHEALGAMPPKIARYKGLHSDSRDIARSLLLD
ncbi:MAG: DUF3445 domain-containing protein [Candidatus Binatia bacterium]|nr:DUF3445 domain-containing protein [Candidatus Binatia bacterium]